jgi:hypothetical protein
MTIQSGTRIGRWTVVAGPFREKRVSARSVNYIDTFECQCDCGQVRRVRKHKLLRNSRSCGCLKRADFTRRATIHGHNRRGNRTRLYSVWDGMTQRCTNARNDNFPMYGGRGIKVCEGWRDFDAFREWALASGYNDTLQIDRRDNNGDYEPENCHWVTDATNKRNTSKTRLLTAFGETKCLTDWALDSRCSVSPHTIADRLAQGFRAETAIALYRRTKRKSPRFVGNHVT